MEGLGSRLGRATSRYGPTATTAVFDGPVRRWKKRWVHVSPSSPSTASHQATQSNGQNGNGTPQLLLRRWTPLPPTADGVLDGGADGGAPADEPPRRKFRYTPIAVIEEQKKAAEKRAEEEAKTGKTGQSPARLASASDEADEKPNITSDDDDDELKDTEVTGKNGSQGSNISDLDLGLGLKGPEEEDDLDTTGETKEIQTEKASDLCYTGGEV